MTLRTLNYRNYGIFLIMGNAGFISFTAWFEVLELVLGLSGLEIYFRRGFGAGLGFCD